MTTTIELTSKKLKLQVILSTVAVLLSMCLFMWAALTPNTPPMVIQLLISTMLVSILWRIVVAVLVWWNHG